MFIIYVTALYIVYIRGKLGGIFNEEFKHSLNSYLELIIEIFQSIERVNMNSSRSVLNEKQHVCQHLFNLILSTYYPLL